MANAVEDADIIVVCISQNYFDSKNCKKELEYADELGKTLVVVKLDPDLQLTGHGSFSQGSEGRGRPRTRTSIFDRRTADVRTGDVRIWKI